MDKDLNNKNINNFFYGNINNLELQEGDNSIITNNTQGFDYDALKDALLEIEKNKDSIQNAFGTKADEFNKKMDRLIYLIDKKENPGLIKNAIIDLRGIAVATGGNLLATGILALLPNL